MFKSQVMSCIGESDRNVENLFANLFDIRYLIQPYKVIVNFPEELGK